MAYEGIENQHPYTVGAFGDLITASLTPVIQIDFIYGINTQTGVSSIANTGVVDVSNSRLRLQSGINSAGSATFLSKYIARYRQGQGMLARFTGVWSSNAVDSTQVLGIGTTQVGYFFGYNGTSFGVCLRNGGLDDWIPQSQWNGDKCDGTGSSTFNWNKTYGNVMQIIYPYLGYGAITFWVQNSQDGNWILCHTIRYPNSSASVQVSNASFPFYANITNSGNTSNLIMYCGSVGIFLTGVREFLGSQWAIDTAKTLTTETSILGLKNATTYNGVSNTGLIRLRSMSVAYRVASSNNYAVIRLKSGVTLGGVPAYTPISGNTVDNGSTITSGNSIASYDVAASTVTGGTYIYNLSLNANTNQIVDLTPYRIFILPSQILTFSGFATASGDIVISVNWNEDS